MFAQPSPDRAATPIFPPAIVEAKSLLMGSFGFDHRLTLPSIFPRFILLRSLLVCSVSKHRLILLFLFFFFGRGESCGMRPTIGETVYDERVRNNIQKGIFCYTVSLFYYLLYVRSRLGGLSLREEQKQKVVKLAHNVFSVRMQNILKYISKNVIFLNLKHVQMS